MEGYLKEITESRLYLMFLSLHFTSLMSNKARVWKSRKLNKFVSDLSHKGDLLSVRQYGEMQNV